MNHRSLVECSTLFHLWLQQWHRNGLQDWIFAFLARNFENYKIWTFILRIFWNEDDNRTGSHLILYRCQWGFSWAQNQEPFNCILFHENLPICVILYVPYDMTHRIFKAYDHPFSNFCHFSRLFRTIKIFENPKIRCVEQRINLWWSHNAEWISLFGCKRRIIGTENSYNRCHESKIWLHRDFELPGNWCKFDHLAMTGEVVPSARVSVLIGRRLLRVSDSIYWA